MKCLLSAFTLLILGALGAQAQPYAVTDLGSLYGDLAMNDQGHVIGFFNGATVLWSEGTPTTIAQGGTYAEALSNNGWVAGYRFTGVYNVPQHNLQHAFLWSQQTGVVDLGAPGGIESWAYDVNDSGQVIGEVGGGQYGNEFVSSFMWQNGIWTDLETMVPASINTRGQIVGTRDGHTVIWEDGISTEISYFVSPGLEINELGQVAGSIPTPTGLHAALWDNGVLTDLGTLGWKTSTFSGFNNRGQVVGVSATLAQPVYEKPFLWQDGVMVDVNTLLPAGSGWQIQTAEDINDSGQIVGKAYVNGVYHAYILTPVPEPSSLLALGMGGLGVLGTALRRRRSR